MAPAACCLPSLPSPPAPSSWPSTRRSGKRSKEHTKAGQGKQLLRIGLLAYDLPLKLTCSGQLQDVPQRWGCVSDGAATHLPAEEQIPPVRH